MHGPDALVVIGDRDRLRQAIGNLIDNAFAHTPAGTAVNVRTYAEGDEAVIEVHDDAGLIPAEQLSRLFDRAWRGDESGPTHGLGLSIVKRIVEEHGGVVETSSDPARGTRFRIVLPRSALRGDDRVAVVSDDGRLRLRDVEVLPGPEAERLPEWSASRSSPAAATHPA